jgi:hypothetical protein
MFTALLGKYIINNNENEEIFIIADSPFIAFCNCLRYL